MFGSLFCCTIMSLWLRLGTKIEKKTVICRSFVVHFVLIGVLFLLWSFFKMWFESNGCLSTIITENGLVWLMCLQKASMAESPVGNLKILNTYVLSIFIFAVIIILYVKFLLLCFALFTQISLIQVNPIIILLCN